MDDTKVNILIIGAGASGLAFALEACRLGEKVRILDKRLERSHVGKATGVAAESWRLLDQYGINLESCPEAIAMRNFLFYDDNKQIAHITVPLIDSNHPAHLFPQSTLEELMEKKLNEKGIFVEYGKEFKHVETSNDVTRASLYNHLSNKIEMISSNWLIAADGVHSNIRKSVNAEFSGQCYNEKWSVAEIKTEQWQPNIQAKLYLDSNGTGLFLSQAGTGKIQGIINSPSIENSLRERFTHYHLIYKRQFNVALKRVSTPKVGNIWLIGDAAHTQSPVGGQGLNLAIWDGITLANALVLNDLSVEKRLIKKAKRVLFFTHFDYKMLSTQNGLLRFLRNTYWKIASRYPFISIWFFKIISGK